MDRRNSWPWLAPIRSARVLQQNFLAMKLPKSRFDGIFANASLKPSSLFPLGFEQKSTPRDRNVAESSAKTLGNSWLGTWNSDAFAKMPSKRLSGNFIARKSCWRTSHSE